MAYTFGSLVFTPAVKALQERYGSRRQYARFETGDNEPDAIGPDEAAFLGERDSFYLATVTSNGWPYIQHRGGPKGFLHVVDEHTVAFADFRGNKQFITAGNLTTDDRVALILVDYPKRLRLKMLGRAKVLEGTEADDLRARVADPTYTATIERVFVIHVEALDWNCPQHITPRFTEDEIREVLAPVEQRMRELEQENERLRDQLARVPRR